MIYYCNSILQYKKSKPTSTCIIVLGYTIYYFICIHEIPTLNIGSFIIINFLIIIFGYSNNFGNTLFKIAIITGVMMFSELIASLLIKTELSKEYFTVISFAEDIIFTFASKLLYITSMIIFRYLSLNRHQRYQSKEMLYLTILPISTCMFLYLFDQIRNVLDDKLKMMFIIFCVLLIATNFATYFVCERIIYNNRQNQRLKQLEFKKEINEKSYRLIQEKYNELKILVHDFEKYCNYINGKISSGQEIQSLTKKLKDKNKEFLIVEYTDNKALNILLSQKIKECNNKNIDFQIYAQNINLSFIEECDVIAIFGNLIDNAVESCINSKEKKIFLKIHTMNNQFLVINLENSADNAPIVKNDKLRTLKSDKNNHGIGLTSVKESLTNYNGHLQWEYNKNKHIFITTILISLNRNK